LERQEGLMSMYYFGRHVFNSDEILRIDLWYTDAQAKVYFRDNDPVILDPDATLEARTFAEDGRRILRIEDETDAVGLEREKFDLARDKLWLEEEHQKSKRKRKART